MWRDRLHRRLTPAIVPVAITVALIVFGACVRPPSVSFPRLRVTSRPAARPGESLPDQFARLVAGARGLQFGDAIFRRNTSVTWIVPEVDRLNLELTAREENFQTNELQSRLSRLSELHQRYFIFSLDLRMPFYPGWTQEELLDFLENNLVVTLENDGGGLAFPERQTFQVIERFAPARPGRAGAKTLEIAVAVRVYFARAAGGEALLTEDTGQIEIKLRLRKRPPFRIGFFDDYFYQGFRWKITAGTGAFSQS